MTAGLSCMPIVSERSLGRDRLNMSTKFAKMPSYDRLNELLEYNPETGELKWRTRRLGTKANGIAGCIRTTKNGRQEWIIGIGGKYYISTRIIWALYHRQDPGLLSIDHVNRDPLDNRIANLRLATAHEQCMNTRCTSPSTATRYLGLVMASNKNNRQRPRWCGRIRISGRLYSFGSAGVDTINEAPPSWLIDRAARLYALRDDPAISDEALIKEITR